jgi:hypothetical protein
MKKVIDDKLENSGWLFISRLEGIGKPQIKNTAAIVLLALQVTRERMVIIQRKTGAKASAVSLLILLLVVVVPAWAQESETQFWPEINAFVKLNEKARLYFIYSATRQDNLVEYSDGQAGGYLDYYTIPLLGRNARHYTDAARNKSLMIRTGYMLDRTPRNSEESSVTHMPTIEAHYRLYLPEKIMLSDRNRMDFKITNGDYRPRYRNRLKIERTFKAGRFELNPYAHVEAFYDWHYNQFNRFRYTGGVEWTLTRRIILESYYTRQRDTAPSAKHVNAIGVVLQFYLR